MLAGFRKAVRKCLDLCVLSNAMRECHVCVPLLGLGWEWENATTTVLSNPSQRVGDHYNCLYSLTSAGAGRLPGKGAGSELTLLR